MFLSTLTRGALVSLTLLLCASAAQGQYLWIEPSGAQSAKVQAGELHKPMANLPGLLEANAVDNQQRALTVTPASGSLNIAAAPAAADVRFRAIEPQDNGAVYFHHSKWGRSETKAVNDLELVPTEPNGNSFVLMWKGRPTAASLVNVDTSAGWRRQLTANQDGSITLPTPFPGMYLLEITVRLDDGSATIDGRKYNDVRHNATLAFEVPTP